MTLLPAIRRERLWAVGLPLALGMTVLGLWQALVQVENIPHVILPAPITILHELVTSLPAMAPHMRATGLESLFAFLLAVCFGFVAAVLLVAFPLIFEAIYPNLVVFQILPKIALAPLFVLWLGVGAPARLTYSVFISFFPVALATMTGLARTDPNALRLCQALGASRWQTFFSVRVPFSMPYFFAGARIAATMSVIGIVIGEFISAREGLGFYIMVSQSRGETAHIFAAILLLCIIGLVIYGITLQAEALVKKAWHGE